MTLLPVLAMANPLPGSSLNQRRQGYSILSPMCTGCGSGLPYSDYQNILAQIKPSVRYNIPWDSTQNGFTGLTTLQDGTPAMGVSFEAADGGSDLGATKGTIGGDLLLSSLQTLANLQSSAFTEACASANGQYFFSTGEGSNCGGYAGP